VKRLLITLSAGLFAVTAQAGDYADETLQRYETSLDHIVRHAGRGATSQEVRNAIAQAKWLNANEAHVKEFIDWLSANHDSLKLRDPSDYEVHEPKHHGGGLPSGVSAPTPEPYS
jgi:hypothetical protein